MTDLFNRDMTLTVGTTQINMRPPGEPGRYLHTLTVEFDIVKDSNRDPNTADITIYNLNQGHRKIIEKGLPVVMMAGYVGDKQLIFEGDIEEAMSAKSSVDWKTMISAKDGGNSYGETRINKSFGKGTYKSVVIESAATAMGLGLGNLRDKVKAHDSKLKKGATVSGRAASVLDRYIPAMGLRWSIQDNQLMLLEKGVTTLEEVYVLNRSSGLVGFPTTGENGRVSFTSLLRGQIKPGRRVQIESKVLEGGKGIYKVDKANYSGSTTGNDWYVHGEGIPVQ